MNRPIKFRGLLADGGGWVKGYYVVYKVSKSNPNLKGIHHCITSNEQDESHAYEVIPETVGQFTGMVDMDGVEVYEGDLIRSFGRVSKVYFYMPNYSFLCDPEDETYQYGLWQFKGKCKVIGNIHENKEK